MARPIHPTHTHEDIQHHTPADHRPGGPAITFAGGSWCAVQVAHVRPDRLPAEIATNETLIEQARRSNAKAKTAAIFRSHDDRRVITFAEISGHDGFRHLRAAWNEHHLQDEHRAVAQSSTLALYQVSGAEEQIEIDPHTHEVYGFEEFSQPPKAVSAAAGLRGALLFASEDGTHAIALYRFEHTAQLQSARPNATRVYPVKTFAAD